MKATLIIFNILIILISSSIIVYVLFSLFFSDPDRRFEIAEKRQGQLYSELLFNILLKQNPSNAHVWMEKSVAYNKNGDYAKGFKLLNKAVELGPEENLGYRGWLRLVKLKDYHGAIKDFVELDGLTPGFVDYPWGENIHLLLAECYSGLKEYDSSLQQFKYYYKSLPGSSYIDYKAFVYEGIVLNKINNYDSAIVRFDKALKIYSKSSEAYFHKAVALRHLNQLDIALIHLNKSLILYDEGYKIKNIYDEAHNELYRTDIEDELEFHN